MSATIPSANEVEEARELLKKYLRPTRLVRTESFERRSNAQVYLKVESDLPTGSFKPRGALFALLTNADRGRCPAWSQRARATMVPRLLMRRASRTWRPRFFSRKILTR